MISISHIFLTLCKSLWILPYIKCILLSLMAINMLKTQCLNLLIYVKMSHLTKHHIVSIKTKLGLGSGSPNIYVMWTQYCM